MGVRGGSTRGEGGGTRISKDDVAVWYYVWYRAHVQRVTSEPLNLRAQKAISVITKRGSKRHTLHRHMEGHSLRGACWNGEIPVMFTLADGDVTALQPPPPHFVRSAHPH